MIAGVLADDLTGALASAARLRDGGARCVVQWRPEPVAAVDAVVADMRTRDYGAAAHRRARTWAAYLRAAGCTRLELRSDSTLRGRPDRELAGALEGWAVADPWVLAVAAYPAAGRRIRGGQLEVTGPAGSSPRGGDVGKALFPGAAVTGLPVALPEMGAEAVVDAVTEAAAAGARRFVADATEETHLRSLARAADLLVRRGAPLVTVSPGAWLRYWRVVSDRRYRLVVLSSPTATNREQLAALRRRRSAAVVGGRALLAGESSLDWSRVGAGQDTVVLETLSVTPRDRADAWMLSTVAAQAARQVLDDGLDRGYRCAGVVVSGGQTASALMDALGAEHVDPDGEVAPLCPRARVRGGSWTGLPLVTKGGLVGAAETLAALADDVWRQL